MIENSTRSRNREYVNKGYLVAVTLLLILAAYLRISFATFGLPFVYNGDELRNIQVIQSMVIDRNLDPRFFHYPSLFFYLNLPSQFLLQNLLGDLLPVSSQSMGNGFAPQPSALLLARLTTLVFGVATVLGTWHLTRLLGVHRSFAVLAALLVAISPLLVRHSSYVTPDVFAGFFVVYALVAAVRIAKSPNLPAYIAAAVLAGLAASTKYNAGIVGLSIPVAHLVSRGTTKFIPMMVVSAVAAVLSFALASPFLVIDYPQAINGFLFELRHYSTGHPGAEGDTLRTNTLWTFRETGWTWVFLCGLAMSKSRWRIVLPVVVFAASYFALLSAQVVRFDRNLIPLLSSVYALSAFGAQQIAATLPRQLGRLTMAFFFLFAAIVGPAQETAHRLLFYVRDPRAAVREWLEAETRDGNRIAVDAYSPFLARTPDTTILGKYSVLDFPADQLLTMDYVLVRRTGIWRTVDRDNSPQARTFKLLSQRACAKKDFPKPPSAPQWTLFKFSCRQ